MKRENPKQLYIAAALGVPVVIWLALLLAPHLGGGLMGIIEGLQSLLRLQLRK